MATFFPGESHTFSEYLLVPGYSSSQCIPNNVSLKTPLTRFKRGEKPAITLNIPMVSAIMQSVSGVDMGVALATEGGLSFIYGSQSAESEAAMVKAVKDHKAGFVQSDSTLTPDMTMEQVIELKEKTGHSTMPVTDDGTPKGKLLGIVTSRDYRPSRDDHQKKVSEFMTPREQLIVGDKNISLKVANDIIWDNKLNSLPVVDDDDCLMYLVFRKDYDSHKDNPLELLDGQKRYVVGAGINTRDYETRIPALLEAGGGVLGLALGHQVAADAPLVQFTRQGVAGGELEQVARLVRVDRAEDHVGLGRRTRSAVGVAAVDVPGRRDAARHLHLHALAGHAVDGRIDLFPGLRVGADVLRGIALLDVEQRQRGVEPAVQVFGHDQDLAHHSTPFCFRTATSSAASLTITPLLRLAGGA